MEFLRYSYLPKEQLITCLKVRREAGHHQSGVHMHDHHELVLVTSDAVCEVVNNGNALTLQGPCIMMNRAGSFHEVVRIMGGDYDSRVVFFHPQVLAELPESLVHEKQLFDGELIAMELSREQVQELEPLFVMISKRSYPLPLLLSVFGGLVQMMNKQTPKRLHTSENYILALIELLQDGTENRTLAQLAEHFHVGQTKLKSDFKRITGIPVMTYRTRVRLDRAKLLLTGTKMDQTQIAYACGFSDESYFIRVFRRQYGMTPGVYRKRFR